MFLFGQIILNPGDDIPLSEPEVFAWIQDYLIEQENEAAVDVVPAAGLEGEIL